MQKSVKFAIGIYFDYLNCDNFILIIHSNWSLQGKDMTNSVLDTDHTKINNKTRNSDEAVNTSLK